MSANVASIICGWRCCSPALLRSATQVRQVGPASGPVWTGSAYTFTAKGTLTGPLRTP
jgi:hypothetical protein